METTSKPSDRPEREVSWIDVILATFRREEFNEEQKRLDKLKFKPAYLPQFKSFMYGALFSFTIVVLMSWVFKILLMTGFGWESSTVIAVIFFLLLFLTYFGFYDPGVITIPIGWEGVPTVLDTRLLGTRVTEGKYWIFWPSVKIERVDIRLQFHDIHATEVISADDIDWDIDGDIIWKIDDVYKRLSTDVADVARAVTKAGQSAFIAVLRKHDENFILDEKDGALAKEIMNAITESISPFGGTVVEFYFSKVLPDPRLIDAKRQIKIEEEQRKSEEIEAKHVAAMIKWISTETGLPPSEAKEVFQSERGKVPMKVNVNKLAMDADLRQALFLGLREIAQMIINNSKK